jgi:hypothetical protein
VLIPGRRSTKAPSLEDATARLASRIRQERRSRRQGFVKVPSQACSAAYIPESTLALLSGRRRTTETRSGMDAVAVVLALAVFALMFGLIRAMDRI